jgi:hypothetical protein
MKYPLLSCKGSTTRDKTTRVSKKENHVAFSELSENHMASGETDETNETNETTETTETTETNETTEICEIRAKYGEKKPLSLKICHTHPPAACPKLTRTTWQFWLETCFFVTVD